MPKMRCKIKKKKENEASNFKTIIYIFFSPKSLQAIFIKND